MLNIPDVGQNLQDQPITMFQWSVNGVTLNPFLNNSTQIEQALAQYDATKTGTLASGCLINTIGFLRIPQSDPILQTYPDPAIGPNSPHYVIAFLVKSHLLCNRINGLTYTIRTRLAITPAKLRQRQENGLQLLSFFMHQHLVRFSFGIDGACI